MILSTSKATEASATRAITAISIFFFIFLFTSNSIINRYSAQEKGLAIGEAHLLMMKRENHPVCEAQPPLLCKEGSFWISRSTGSS